MKNKKILILGIGAIILICVIVFVIFNYKNLKNGNTMINKSEEEIKDYILNISSYEALVKIEVQTNKNKNNYVVKQSLKDNVSKQEVIEPENIAGVVTFYDGNNLSISNNKLELTTTYENYQYMVENSLWLDSFIREYKELQNYKMEVNENEIILNLKNENGNKYNVYKQLYIDKKTAKPTKMIIQDINKNTLVYILYTEIEIS